MKFDFGFQDLLAPMWLRRWGPLRRAPGSLLDRTSLHYYALSASLGAVMTGAFALAMVVLKKSLHASVLEIGIMSAIGPTSLLLGIFGGELVRGRDKRPVIALFGGISRGVLLLFALVHSAWAYIAVNGLFNSANALLAPGVTTLWQSNISPRSRNALWGLTASLTTVVAVLVSLVVGWLLDKDGDAYRWIFPLTGLLGLLGIYVLVRMPHRGKYKHRDAPPHTLRGVFVSPIRRFIRLLRSDGDFRHFEAAFFLYGCAFMLTAPVLPHYLVDLAKMNYRQVSVCEGMLFSLGTIALSMPWGKYMDRTSPSATCVAVFLMLSLFPTILLIGPFVAALGLPLVYIVYLAYTVYGIGMSGLGVAWNLAPLSFAGKADASTYTGAHITLTGVRGAVAPIASALLQDSFGYKPVLAAAACLFLLAAAGMHWLEVKRKRRKRADSASGPAAAEHPAA